MLRLALCLLLLLPLAAQARLGETYEQCIARYGPPVEEVSDLPLGSLKGRGAIFQSKDGWEVFAIFADGQAVQIAYSRLPVKDLAPDQIQKLLDANSGGEKWTVLNPGKSRYYWQTTRYNAVHDLFLRQLIFTDRDYYDRLQEFKAQPPDPKPKNS